MTEDVAPPGSSAPARRRAPGQIAWAEIRAAYEGSDVPLQMVADAYGISLTDIYPRAEREGWLLRRRRRTLERKARRTATMPDKVDPAALVERMFRAVARQIDEIELRITDSDGGASARDARTLSTLARTLDLLIALERGAAKPDTEARTDIDDLRRDLARRIEGLRGS